MEELKNKGGGYDWRLMKWNTWSVGGKRWEVRFFIYNIKLGRKFIKYDEIYKWFHTKRHAEIYKNKFIKKIQKFNIF